MADPDPKWRACMEHYEQTRLKLDQATKLHLELNELFGKVQAAFIVSSGSYPHEDENK